MYIRVLHHFAVFILELLPYPYLQDATLNLPNPYLGSTTVLVDVVVDVKVIWAILEAFN